MPAQSKKQQMAAGAALSAKRGDQPKSKMKGASKQMAESMTEKQLEDLASTKRKKLPRKKMKMKKENRSDDKQTPSIASGGGRAFLKSDGRGKGHFARRPLELVL